MPAKKENAYLTVYLTLTLAVMLSLCLALIESVRSNAVYMEAECITDIALNSIFAEYHQELLKQYNLFAIDSSYGMSVPGVSNTEQHLSKYLKRNMSSEDIFLDRIAYRDFLGLFLKDVKITKVLFLTDGNGAVFRRRAIEAVKDDMGLNLYHELNEWMRVVEVNKLSERDIASEKQALDRELESYNGKKVKISDEKWDVRDGERVKISEEQWKTVEVENPTDALEKKRKEGILKHVVDDPEQLSSITVSMDNLISARSADGIMNHGNMELYAYTKADQLLERFFFQEYLLRYMGNYRKQSEEDALKYQIEYLIAGKENDLDNLRSVANTLCAIREASNISYLYSDQEKKGIAELAGYALAMLLMIPEAADVFEAVLLFGWAYAESVYDVKCLLAGGRVPLMKSAHTWHYGLENALNFADSSEDSMQENGLSYEDYLRILMMLKKEDVLTMRAMNMVEADIRLTPGNRSFRLDGCFDSVEASMGIDSTYGYSCEITRQKGYSTQ